ncbi:MAG: aminotransferase class IV [Acidobacteria bacterium]|nr:aminotransferase class IV [Acidobacteriota bacterium]
MHRFILHNDRIHEASDKLLSPGQVGLLSGWGVFTTIKVVDGVLFAFERHWMRMSRDAARMRVPLPPEDRAGVHANLMKLVEANQAHNCTLRLVVVRNGGGMWEGPGVGRSSDLVALTANSKDWGRGVKLTCVPQARHSASAFAGTKILAWAPNLTWLEEAQSKGFDEVILLNERGEVSECTSANLFVAKGTQVGTPPLRSSGCLPGVTRELLLSEVKAEGITVTEQVLLPMDLDAADEVFITSTTRDLLPVLEIDGRPVAQSGRTLEPLRKAFGEYARNYVAKKKNGSK